MSSNNKGSDKSAATEKLLSQLQSYTVPKTRIRAVGVHLPEKIIDNKELMETLQLAPLLRFRLATLLDRLTGIQTRRYAPPGTPPSDLALEAAKNALIKASLSPKDIDTLIFASTDTDLFEPATANILQQKLGIEAVNSFDIKNACNSMLQGINVANSLIMSGAAERVLIASGEMGSYGCNREITGFDELDEKLGGLTLGDAGAALIIEKSDGKDGILEVNLTAFGEHWDLCHVPCNPSWRHHPMKEIGLWFRLKGKQMTQIAREWTQIYFNEYARYRKERYGEQSILDSAAYLIPHQITKRFIQEIIKSLRLDEDRVWITAHKYGNTGSTSLPLALHDLMETGLLRFGSGQEVMLYGAASGFGIGHVRMRL